MAKRFTDTKKWDDEWFYLLPGKMMLAWDYLNAHCDSVGIWKLNLRKLSDLIKFEVTPDEFNSHFGPKLVPLPKNRVWIPSFVPFQYKKLSSKNRAHLGMMRTIIAETESLPLDGDVLELVNKFKHIVFEGQPTLSRESPDSPGKGKSNGNGNGKECIKGGAGEIKPVKPKRIRKEYTPEFESDYKQYPRQEGKSEGHKIYADTILTDADRARLRTSIANYTELCRRENREQRHIKHFGTFMGCWKDYENTTPNLLALSEQRVSCTSCTSGLIRAVNRSSGHSEHCACSCELGRKKSTYLRFDESKYERAAP